MKQQVLRLVRYGTVLSILAVAGLVVSCRNARRGMPSEITLSYHLQRLSNAAEFEQPPLGIPGMISTYDRTGGNDDWADFTKMKSGDLYVLADLKGPGCVHRIWMTSVPADEWLFFFDGETTPRVKVKGSDIFGKAEPFLPPLCDKVSNGSYSYMPLPYSKSLKICIAAKSLPQGTRAYFHVNYETYPAGTQVKSFSPKLNAEENQVLEQTQALWREMKPAALRAKDACGAITNSTLAPQQTWRWLDNGSSGRLATFWIRPRTPQGLSYAGRSQLLRALTLRFYWDEEKQPSVVVPLGDFFCNGLRQAEFASLPLACIGGTYICRFPMSFRRGVRAEIQNMSYMPITIEAGYDIQPPEQSGQLVYFHANWNQSTSSGAPLQVARLRGAGHLVGCYVTEI
ncbi:MAG: DUF2961 domain-containing protein, partial [bacterium]